MSKNDSNILLKNGINLLILYNKFNFSDFLLNFKSCCPILILYAIYVYALKYNIKLFVYSLQIPLK